MRPKERSPVNTIPSFAVAVAGKYYHRRQTKLLLLLVVMLLLLCLPSANVQHALQL